VTEQTERIEVRPRFSQAPPRIPPLAASLDQGPRGEPGLTIADIFSQLAVALTEVDARLTAIEDRLGVGRHE
jgi:hypothetical protein